MTHLILLPCEDPSHGIRALFAMMDATDRASPVYVDADGIKHTAPFARAFPLVYVAMGAYRREISEAIESMVREAYPETTAGRPVLPLGGTW